MHDKAAWWYIPPTFPININSICWITLNLFSWTKTLIRKRKIKTHDIQDQFLNFLSRGVILARPPFCTEYQNRQQKAWPVDKTDNTSLVSGCSLPSTVIVCPALIIFTWSLLSLRVTLCLCQFVLIITQWVFFLTSLVWIFLVLTLPDFWIFAFWGFFFFDR